jgi:hypothetical protein
LFSAFNVADVTLTWCGQDNSDLEIQRTFLPSLAQTPLQMSQTQTFLNYYTIFTVKKQDGLTKVRQNGANRSCQLICGTPYAVGCGAYLDINLILRLYHCSC